MGPWHLTISEEEISKHRDAPRVHQLLTLGRISNSLRFAEAAIYDRANDDSPAGNRQRTAAFLYACAVLDEAFGFVDRLGQHWRHLSSFPKLMVPLLHDAKVMELRNGLLDRLRNQAVYHHDDDVMPLGLATLRMSEYVVAQGATGKKADLFHPLSDFAVISFGLGPIPAGETFASVFQQALGDVMDIQIRFGTAVENLLGEAFADIGWGKFLARDVAT